ncbi:MAG: hypothetical protein HN416_13895 [Nitrospina sp.]|jgi:hypothetical protein|nr:hypothetical protein [Nitrospina sp.]
MSAIIFQNNEKGYISWINKHKSGFVLNIGKDNNPEYRVLHSASCGSIIAYHEGKEDDMHTGRGYIKICAKTLKEINEWVKNYGGATKPKSHRCTSEIIKPYEYRPPKKFIEGEKKTVLIKTYERDSKARDMCIKHHGVNCSVCGFNFEKKYGEVGKGFIHVHHLTPLSEIGKKYSLDPINDLRPVCPNCHAMIHKFSPAKSLEEIKALLSD